MKFMNIGIMTAVLAIMAGAIQAQAGTLAYWRFHTDGGAPVTNGQLVTSADDSSGNGNSLFPYPGGTATYAVNGSGVFPSTIPRTGQANGFYLADNYNGLTNANLTVAGATTYTIEGYFRKTLADGSMPRTLVSWVAGGAYYPTWVSLNVGYDGEKGPGTGSQLAIGLGGIGGHSTTNANIQGNTTHHFALTLSGGGYGWVIGTYRLYVDGVLLLDVNEWAFINSAAKGISVGIQQIDQSQHFAGVIDEIRISDQALTPNQFLNARPVSTVLKFY